AQLIALRHLDDVERRPVENDVGPLLSSINLDVKTVEFAKTRIEERRRCAHLCPIFIGYASVRSISYSPTTSLRRSSLPAGDLGMDSTNTKRRGRLKLARPEVRQNRSRSSCSTGARRLMKAATILPQRRSGRPTTATSATAGCSDRQRSISTGETF